MHRMRRTLAKAGLALVFLASAATSARADLLTPPGGQSYPDIAGGISGSQSYSYDPVSRTGLFQVTTSPYALLTGPSSSQDFIVNPTTGGDRAQTLSLTLNSHGQLVAGGTNSFSITGSVDIGGTTYSGVLLQATASSFGTSNGTDAAFNVKMNVIGGLLKDSFGPVAFLELHSLPTPSFNGTFAHGFASTLICSNVVGYESITPTPSPEPTALWVLIAAGGFWAAKRNHRRLAARFGRGV